MGLRPLCFASLLVLGAIPAAAQDLSLELVTPPRLVRFVEATYPPQAKAEKLEGKVELELTIGRDGRVTDAGVVTPAGNGFDEAALEAVRQFLFEPARRDWKPVVSRIRYLYVFELKTEDLEEVTTGSIVGRLVNALDDKPVELARIELIGDDGKTLRATQSDAEGTFRFDELAPGEYGLEVFEGRFG